MNMVTGVDMESSGYCTIDQVAAYLAVSRRTVYRMIEDGELHRYKHRGVARLAKREVRSLMEGARV